MTNILIASNNQLKYIYPTDEGWLDINDLCILMEPIYEATKLISGSSYPTQEDLYIAFTIIMELLESKMTEN
ncbi:7968_t:CDS:2 [Funneliformis geosporum]|nr:7968_t:CDS:2 [Funneliformis geosporum]